MQSKTFVQNVWLENKNFCKTIIGVKQDFCSNVCVQSKTFSQIFEHSARFFVQTFWVQMIHSGHGCASDDQGAVVYYCAITNQGAAPAKGW